jgi:murein DD-endopeptidase MepM/ murein hydrolase activator NlpD
VSTSGKVATVVAAAATGLVLLLLTPLLMVAAALAAAGATTNCTAAGSPLTSTTGQAGSAAGLTGEQSVNARTIVSVALGVVGARLGAAAGQRAAVIAVATAMQESTLRNLGYGDRDSIGLFQQRNAWGSREQRMDPVQSTTMFLTGGRGQRGLLAVAGWQSMPVWQAAQSVQVSAFPTAYARWEALARTVVSSVAGTVVPIDAAADCPAAGTVSAGGWVVPLPKVTYTLSSGFGMRLHPVYGTYRMHDGQDLAAATGTPVAAAAPGKVTFAGVSGSLTSGFGRLVVVDHGGGTATFYGHLSAISVTAGQAVTAGQVIGAVGSTGGSTGPHLHFQVDRAGTPIDPVGFMTAHGAAL